MWSDVKKAVDQCQTCMMSRHIDPRELTYHPLEVAHAPRQVFYMDLLGPVTGIKSEQRFILTCIDGFSRLLATRPIPNRRAKTMVAALHSILTAEMGIPAKIVCDRGSEFVSMDTRALVEGQLGVKKGSPHTRYPRTIRTNACWYHLSIRVWPRKGWKSTELF